MAKAMKNDHGKHGKEHGQEHGKLATLRETMPMLSMPPWMERIDELVGERFGHLWPMFRMGEELTTFKVPPVDVFEDGDDIVLKAELPGMKREEIRVEVTGDLVTLSGTKEKVEKVERKDYHRMERASGSFSRTVRLPAEVDLEKVSAKFTDGVLEVRAPRLPGARSKKIEVG